MVAQQYCREGIWVTMADIYEALTSARHVLSCYGETVSSHPHQHLVKWIEFPSPFSDEVTQVKLPKYTELSVETSGLHPRLADAGAHDHILFGGLSGAN